MKCDFGHKVQTYIYIFIQYYWRQNVAITNKDNEVVSSANDKAIQNQQHLTRIYRTETTQAKDVDEGSPFLGKPLMKLKWKIETSKIVATCLWTIKLMSICSISLILLLNPKPKPNSTAFHHIQNLHAKKIQKVTKSVSFSRLANLFWQICCRSPNKLHEIPRVELIGVDTTPP